MLTLPLGVRMFVATERVDGRKGIDGLAACRRTAAHGRARADGAAMLPAPPPKIDLPRGYAETLREMKARIQQARVRTVLAANATVIRLYWDLGRMILLVSRSGYQLPAT